VEAGLKIGVVGIGKMGAAIAERLLALGHEVTVWNRTAAKTKALAAAGAHAAKTPAELAARCELVLSILTDAAAIATAFDGRDGLLTADVAGKLFIEMSTVRPDTAKALAARINAKGAAMIDCPVGGTVGPAKDGKLFGFVGGDAKDVARAKPVLDQLCRRIEHVGAVGSGASMKLAINLPLLVYWQSLGEALTLCRSLGIDGARLIDIISDTSGAPAVLKVRGAAMAAAVNGVEPAQTTFDIDSVRKDLRTMIEEAASFGARLPVTAQALECFDQAAEEGLGAKDCAMLPVRWSKLHLQ
jgi:3-hydroxyisobutyrate dehydrogenase